MIFKTTQKDFVLFQSECRYWVDFFGLVDWSIDFLLEDLKEEFTFARAQFSYLSRIATIKLNSKIDEKLTEHKIKKTALHEVLHIVHAKCFQLMKARFVSEDEIDEADHELVVRLTNCFLNIGGD